MLWLLQAGSQFWRANALLWKSEVLCLLRELAYMVVTGPPLSKCFRKNTKNSLDNLKDGV